MGNGVTNDPRELASASAEKHGRDGAQEDLKIQKEGPLVDVLKIEANPIGKIVHIVSTGDLPKAGHAWRNAEATALVVRSHGKSFIGGERARTDKTHLSKQDIEELG